MAKSKAKVEPFWDWTALIRVEDGRTLKKVLHTSPRMEPPGELTHDGKRYAKTTSDFTNRRVTYKRSLTLNERASAYFKAEGGYNVTLKDMRIGKLARTTDPFWD